MSENTLQFVGQNWQSILLAGLILSVCIMTMINILVTTEEFVDAKSIGDYSKGYQYVYFAMVLLVAIYAWFKIDK